eukprot:Phypoly_transcript_06887.p1 GENE.Phypoly_transcript_06887~~Phypoly_transcript_06887.p1  ORF type:complete len:566 (+),score=102.95 Phypoly_transcript_06887:54-1700(+)
MNIATCGHTTSVVPRAVLSFILARRLASVPKDKVRDTKNKKTSTPPDATKLSKSKSKAPTPPKSSSSAPLKQLRVAKNPIPSIPPITSQIPITPNANPTHPPTDSTPPIPPTPFSPLTTNTSLPTTTSLPSYETYRISHPLLDAKTKGDQQSNEGEKGNHESEMKRNGNFTVYLGVSGGVDSSVSALLLKLQGFNVVGVYMKCWDEKDEFGVCKGEQDLRDAQDVCKLLDIPFKQVDFVKEYWHEVFTDFLEGYKKGITPNPDVLCNKKIKFHHFLNYCLREGADFVATGHYARVAHTPDGQAKLLRATDLSKDQSYFLANVDSDQLQRVLFPVGNLAKTQVRKIATETDLPTARKKNSVGLCFVGKRSLPDFLSQYIDAKEGRFKTVDGVDKGIAKGYNFLTTGQRTKIPGQNGRLFVTNINPSTNTVTICEGSLHPALYYDYCLVRNFVWINGPPNAPFSLECTCQVRYHQRPSQCKISSTPQPNVFYVEFYRPQKAVTRGQTLVLYKGEECIGGGEIHKTSPTYHDLKKPLPPGFVDDSDMDAPQ